MAGLPGYAPVAPKTLQVAQAQVHAIDQQQGFHAPVVVPPTDGSGFVAPGQGIGSAVRYDIATGYQGNDPAHPVNFATGGGMVQGGAAPVRGLPGVQRVGNSFSNTAPGLPAGVEQNGNSFYSAPPAPSPEAVKQHLNAALVAHLQKSIQNAALPSWFNQEQQQQNAIQAKGAAAENYLRQTAATQQAQAAAQAAHLQAVQQQAQNSPITTGLNAAIHSVGSGVLGDVGGLAGGLGDLTGWKGAQQFGHNLIGASIQQAGKAAQQEAALSKAKGLGSYVGAGVATLAPYLLGPEVAANTFAQNAALQGAQNGDSFGRNLAGAALQGAAGVAGAPEARMVEDALHGIAKGAVTHAMLHGALYGAAGGAASGAGQSITNGQTLAQGAEDTAENAGIGTLLGGGAGALTHGATSLAGKLLARKPAAVQAAPETTPTIAAEPAVTPPEQEDEITKMLAKLGSMQAKPAEATTAAEATPAPVSGADTELNNLPENVLTASGQAKPVRGLGDVAAPVKLAAKPMLPSALTKAAPRYGTRPIQFGSDLDKAAYIIGNPATKSKSHAQYLNFVKQALGTDEAGATAYGQKVRAAIKQAAGGGPGTGTNPILLDDQRPAPAQNTAAAVAPVSEAAAGKPAATPVVTPADVQGMNAKAEGLVGDDAAEVKAATDADSGRLADAADKILKEGKLTQTEEPNTQDQPMLDNLGAQPISDAKAAELGAQTPGAEPTVADQFGASVMTPLHEKALDLLQNSKDQRATVADLSTRLKSQADLFPKGANKTDAANQVIKDLVDNGHASLGFKDNKNGISPFLVARTGQKSALAPMSLTHQAVLAHLENQAQSQMEGRIAGLQQTDPAAATALQEKLRRNDFSGEPILNPTAHADWMAKRFGMNPKDAQDALDGLTASNEISPLDPELLAAGASARGTTAGNLSGYSINAQDPRLNRTTINNVVKDKEANKYEGWRQSELARLSEALPDNSPEKPLVQKTLAAFTPGGDAQNRADPLNDAMDTSGDVTPKRPVTQLAEEQTAPVAKEPALDEQPPADPEAVEEQASKAVSDIQANLAKERAKIAPTDRHAARKQKALDEAAAWAEANKTDLKSVATSALNHGMAPTPAMQKLTDFVDHILGKGRVHVGLEPRPGALGYTDLQKIALMPGAFKYGHEHVIHHEAAHVIRELYLTDAEKKMTDQALAPGSRRYEKLMAWARQRGGSTIDIIKKQPYERFSYYAEAISKGDLPKPTGVLGRIYSKVLDHMERLHSALHGAGYKNIDDIMQAMQEGKFAERGPVRSLEEGRRNLSFDMQSAEPLESAAPDEKPNLADPQTGYAIHEAMQALNNPSMLGKAAQTAGRIVRGTHELGKHLADEASVPSVKAHMEPLFRPLWRAWENRYRTGREVESSVGHAAPIWFDPTVGNGLKYRSARRAATKILQAGDHERKTFDDAELESRFKASPETVEAYHQALAAMGKMHDYDIQRFHDELAHQRKLGMESAADISKRLDSPIDEEREKAIQQGTDLKDTLELAQKSHDKSVARTNRLRAEGYIPHFRDGKFLTHIKASLPTGELELRKHMLKMEQDMPALEKRLLDPKKSRAAKAEVAKQLEIMNDLHARYQQALEDGEDDGKLHLITTGHHFDFSAQMAAKDAKNPKYAAIFKKYGIDPAKITTQVERKPAPAQGGLGMEAAQRLLEGLNDDGVALSTDQRLALLRQVVDADSTGFNKHVERKDIAGEDDDVRKALAHWAVFTGEQMGAHRTAGERADAMRGIRQSGNAGLASYAEAYEKGLHADGAQPGFEKAIRSATGLAMLGGNLKAPLYALQNMPFAMANLSRNERGMGSLRYTKALKDVVGLTAHKLGAAVDKGEAVPGLTKAETQTMWKAHQAGDLAPQYANLVLGAHGGSSVGRQALEHALMSPLAVTENHLRMATYLAALRQHAALLKAGKKPLGLDMDAQGKRQAEMNPETYARDMSNLSNQNYQREDTIPLLGKLGDLRTMLQFATPQARNLSMLHHMARTNPLIGAALVAGAAGLGGYQALPLAEDAESGYNGLSAWMATHGYHLGSLGDGQSAQALVNQGMINNLPPKLAELAMHGGLHNVFGMDLSQFVGLGNSVGDNLVQLGADAANPGLHLIAPDDAAPATSFVSGVWNTGQAASNGDWMKAARSLPVPVVENLIRAAEAAKVGRFTTPTGSTVMKSSPGQIAAATVGLPTTKLQDSYDELGQARYAQTVSKLVKDQALQDVQASMEQPGSQGLAAKGSQIIQSYAKAAPWSHEFITGQDYSELMRRHMLNSLTPMERLRLGEYSGRGLKPTPPVAVHP